MPGFTEYADYDALGLAKLIRAREIQPLDVMQAAIETIERLNPTLNAVVLRLFERALTMAKASPEGPFAGVPYLLKDMVPYKDTLLTYGSAFLRKANYMASESHEVVIRAERSGLIVLGKTNTSELGLLPATEPEAYGPTKNPWDLTRSPGGSSGGAGAAVAAGMVPMAHGSDGGGSIRIPASACGVFGFKPSRGRNPSCPFDHPDGFVTEHCLSRSVRDSAALLDVTQGPLPGDRWWAPPPQRPYLEEVSADPGRLRIAFSTHDLAGRPAHPDCQAAVLSVAKLCQELGHEVDEAIPDIDGERYYDAFFVLWSLIPCFFFKLLLQQAERQGWMGKALSVLGEKASLEIISRLTMGDLRKPAFERWTRELAKIGRQQSPADLWLAWQEMNVASRTLSEMLTRYDCFLSPVLGAPPQKTGWLADLATSEVAKERALRFAGYTPICNTAGLPAMSMPLYWNAENLPIGTHFIGRFGDETTLFRLAGQLEQARPWWNRRPKF